MKLHAFVAMPFGIKLDLKGQMIDFTRIYLEMIKPALEQANLEVIRADEERHAGDIREDMFQELLIADLVLVDLSIDNPNVWYELGVRHALRSGGILLIQGPRDIKPFDLYTDRKYTYHLKQGVPDLEHLTDDRLAITQMAISIIGEKFKRTLSPVYSLLPNLTEPNWKDLKVGSAKNYWALYDEWARRVELARKKGFPEDILVLANEPPTTALRMEAIVKAGKSLMESKLYQFALEQFEIAHFFEPTNKKINHYRVICLQRLGDKDAACSICQSILEVEPKDAETYALLGKIYKDAWLHSWNRSGSTIEEYRKNAGYEEALLLRSIESYFTAFEFSPSHYYSGINAVTLISVYHDLLGQDTIWSHRLQLLIKGVEWSAVCEKNPSYLYWARATLAELTILSGTTAQVVKAYKDAISIVDNDWFSLDSTLSQLKILAKLDFHSEKINSAMNVFEHSLAYIKSPDNKWQPSRVFLFSGHMVDPPLCSLPRFPESKVAIASSAIEDALEHNGATENDLALTQGAAGGDILFAEAALKRNMRVQFLQPFIEAEFIERSILPSTAGNVWRRRYFQVRSNPLCMPVRTMPVSLGPLAKNNAGEEANPYERCNRWLLNSALIYGVERVHFICLWNGCIGNGPGGTEYMYKEVQRRTGNITWLDTRILW